MTAAVDASALERIERWGEHLGILAAERDAFAAQLADLEVADEEALLTADPTQPRDRSREGEARRLREDLTDLGKRIATLTTKRDALVAQLEAEQHAARLAAEHERAVAEVEHVARDGADWAERALAVFLGPIDQMDATVLLAVAGAAGPLLARESAAAIGLSTALGNLDRYSPPPASTLLDQVIGQLPGRPPRRGLFVIARTGHRSAVYRALADLLDIPGA